MEFKTDLYIDEILATLKLLQIREFKVARTAHEIWFEIQLIGSLLPSSSNEQRYLQSDNYKIGCTWGTDSIG